MISCHGQEGLLNSQAFKFRPFLGLGRCARTIVQVQAKESQGDAGGLERRGARAEPDNSDNDDKNAFYQ